MMAEHCHSWPHCGRAPAANSVWCPEHRDLLARCRDELAAEGKRQRTIKGLASRAAAPVKVTRIEPAAPSVRRVAEAYRETILQALEDGPLTGRQLARAVKAKSTDRSFSRARRALLDAGEIQSSGASKEAKRYALAEQSEAAA